MKQLLLSALLLPFLAFLPFLPAMAQEPRWFNGYEQFYASLPGRLFQGAGKEIAVSAAHRVRIDGKQYRLDRASVFPGESIHANDLGTTALLYRSAGHYCVEGMGATSGTASRHRSVYLIERKSRTVFKLASLFGHCSMVRKDQDGKISFTAARIVNYRAAYDADGVAFSGYTLIGGQFRMNGEEREVRFIEHDDFYQFQLLR